MELNAKEVALVGLMMSIIAAMFNGDDESLNSLLHVLSTQVDDLAPLYVKFDKVVDSPEVSAILEKFNLEHASPTVS